MLSLLRAVVLLLALSLGTALGVAPTVTDPLASDIVGGAVKLNAKVTANNLTTVVTFSYRDAATAGNFIDAIVVPDVAPAEVNKPVSVNLAGLVAGHTYEFKVKAAQTGGDTTIFPTTLVFKEVTNSPTLTIDAPPTHSGGTSTVHGTAFAPGVAGEIFFEYGLTTAYELGEVGNTPIAAGATVSIDSNLLPAGATYHYRLRFRDAGLTFTTETPDALNNRTPIAVADAAEITDIVTITIDVLANDSDPDNDDLTISSVSNPKHGTAVISGDQIDYTPGADFRDSDSFTYKITDTFGATATATVTIRSLRSSLAGTHGGLIKKSNGREIGYFTLSTSAGGSFTGIAIINGERYVLTGVLAADGTFSGFASGRGGIIPVRLSTKNEDAGAVITATFNNGQYTADLNVSDTEAATRVELARRYTAGIGAGGSGPTNGNDPGNPPEGSGWLAVRVRQDGTAAIKGRLSDGRSFSTRGTVNLVEGVATLTFYDDLEATRFIGNLTLSDTVDGTVRTDRDSSGDGLYARGYDITQTVDGARYLPPPGDKRVLDTQLSKGQDLTISFSGDALGGSVTRDLYLNDHDKVKVLNSTGEDLKIKIDRRSGRFQAKFTIDDEGRKLKATGVLIQATDGGTGGRGIGTFETSLGTGTVTISASSAGGTPTPTPDPVPVPVVP